MNIEKIREQLKTKLAESEWDRVLNEFIDSSDFEILMKEIAELNKENKLTPNTKQIFRAFYECPYDELKVIILGQDPYCEIEIEYDEKGKIKKETNIADGLAFSCSNTNKPTSVLNVIFDEIKNTYYKDECWYAWEPDLTRWAKQGVLLLNTALTTEPDKIGMHYIIWKPFMEYLFKKLNELNHRMIYVFMGAVAKEWAKKIPESNYKFYCYHPQSALYSDGIWESNDIFMRINEIVESNNGTKIIW